MCIYFKTAYLKFTQQAHIEIELGEFQSMCVLYHDACSMPVVPMQHTLLYTHSAFLCPLSTPTSDNKNLQLDDYRQGLPNCPFISYNISSLSI